MTVSVGDVTICLLRTISRKPFIYMDDYLESIRAAERHLGTCPSGQLSEQLEAAKQRYLGLCIGTEHHVPSVLSQVRRAVAAVHDGNGFLRDFTPRILTLKD